MTNIFLEKLSNKWGENKFVCIGLDQSNLELNKSIIDQTYDLVCAYKLNSAFYEAQGLEGRKSLEQTIAYIKKNYPDIPMILDAKRGDIGNTNQGYVKDVFDNLAVDAVTVNPYLGRDSLKPFLERADKGIFVLVRTSNPGAGEFQDLTVEDKPLYEVVAQHVREWNTNGNLGVVVGATYPDQLKVVREIIGDMPILIPGVGSQDGDVTQAVKMGLDNNKQGIIINSSRGIIFSDNPREATLKLHQQIQEALKSV